MIVVQSGYFSAPRLPPGVHAPDLQISTISIRICGCTTRPAARCWRRFALPANAVGAPITYMAGGKQYIAFPVGGGPLVEELIAVAL